MTAASAAVITNGVVTNMIVVDVDQNRKTTFELEGSEIVVLPDGSSVSMDYTYSKGKFTPPTPKSDEEVQPSEE